MISYIDHILLLNGPNLNLLGNREIEKYGSINLYEIIENLKKLSKKLKVKLSHIQSNAEHILIENIHQAQNNVNFIIINPAAFTHTSIAIRDAILSVKIPFIEIHISNIYSREKFRHNSYFSDIAEGVICGFGAEGYFLALKMAVKKLLKCKSKKINMA